MLPLNTRKPFLSISRKSYSEMEVVWGQLLDYHNDCSLCSLILSIMLFLQFLLLPCLCGFARSSFVAHFQPLFPTKLYAAGLLMRSVKQCINTDPRWRWGFVMVCINTTPSPEWMTTTASNLEHSRWTINTICPRHAVNAGEIKSNFEDHN